jgi:adenylate cyclase, class 2
MKHTNIEIKARCSKEHQDKIRDYLLKNCTVLPKEDYQIDTYFKVNQGRLKIRKSNVIDELIYYERDDGLNSKKSKVNIININQTEGLEEIIRKTNKVLIVVNKKREIYFINNVKFHIDEVKDLGNFIEIEAISENDSLPIEKIKEQCDFYKKIFEINESDLIKYSYSDMLLNKRKLESK